MLITLSTPTFDPLGFVQIHAFPSSDTKSITRRVNRVATLDGGVAINDTGYTDGDRNMSIQFRPTPELSASIKRLARLHPRIHATTDEGVFEAAISTYTETSSDATLALLIIKRITE